jgi:glycosyltransferase involved in cell wall biosynthesis
LIEAFSEVAREAVDLKLVLTGRKDGEEYETVMAAIGGLELGERVRILGYIAPDELCAIYRLASVLVMPSLFESVSIPIYEAFQAGTPVVASGILAIPEQVGEAGLLFDPTSAASIRDTILQVTRDPDGARRRASLGRDRMRAMTPERYGGELQNLLRGLK